MLVLDFFFVKARPATAGYTLQDKENEEAAYHYDKEESETLEVRITILFLFIS